MAAGVGVGWGGECAVIPERRKMKRVKRNCLYVFSHGLGICFEPQWKEE